MQSEAAYAEIETRAMAVASNLGAEYWPTSSKTGIFKSYCLRATIDKGNLLRKISK